VSVNKIQLGEVAGDYRGSGALRMRFEAETRVASPADLKD
jgi:hypothetical protein